MDELIQLEKQMDEILQNALCLGLSAEQVMKLFRDNFSKAQRGI